MLLGWGSPPFLHVLAAQLGIALPGQGVPPYPPAGHSKHALPCGGSPPSSISWLHAGAACGLVGVSPPLSWLRAGSGRCWVRGPPPSPPCGAARIKRTVPFKGYPILVGILRLASCKECALSVQVPRLCRPHVYAPCLHGGLGAIPTFLWLRGGWIARRLLWRQ